MNENFGCFESEEQEIQRLADKLQGTDLVDEYRTQHRTTWRPDPVTGHDYLPVLQQLWGQPLDNSLVAYLHSLRPSSVRITDGVVTCDSQPWRVTVVTDSSDGAERILSIHQEVSVGFGSAHNVRQAMRRIRESPPLA